MKIPSIAQPAPTHIDSPLMSVSATLGGIVLLILLVAWLAKRFGLAGVRMTSKRTLQISASVSVGTRERVVVVDVEDARLVLGVTASHITHLHTLPLATDSEQPLQKDQHHDFQKIMKKLLKRNEKA